MKLTLLVHVLAGTLGLLSGYVALSASKGAALHRKSGMLFVYMMVILSMTGLLISVGGGVSPAMNIPTALLTLYLVITGMRSVAPRDAWSRRIDVAAMIMAFALAAGYFVLAAGAIGAGGARAGMAYPFIMFGGVALAAGVGDRRVIRDGAPHGGARLRRHLWRLCFALFVSALALVSGRLPKALQIPALNAAGVVAPLAAMAYWKWRLRANRPVRDVVRISVPEAV